MTGAGSAATLPTDSQSAARPAFPPRRVYTIAGVPAEVQAYAMAKYSRSSQGMLESIQELSQQKAEHFLDTFYFQYGHRSIADLAHLVFGVEQISILAAIALVDEQVWDGQERSTRYQPFLKTGWYTPQDVAASAADTLYQQTASGLVATYDGLARRLLELLVDATPRPAEMPDGAFRRTLRARAFDIARMLLPLATHTSVGQVVSARVVERQISRLLTSRYAELRAVGAELKASCREPAEAPLLDRPPLADFLAEAAQDSEALDLLRPRAAPTLVKYAEASLYQATTAVALEQAAAQYLAAAGEPDRSRPVVLVPAADPLAEIAATLLYKHDRDGRSYAQSLQVVADLGEARKREILDLSLTHRGRYDDLLREHQAGYALAFDVLMDLGAFRDLHRHRRCVQVQQPLTWVHGFDPAEEVFQAGLGPRLTLAALEDGLGTTYADGLARAEQAAGAISTGGGLDRHYLMPLAYRTRCLFKMDWAQAVYMIEQRTAPAGHFSYRRTAWAMFEALRERFPALAEPIRATNPFEPFDLLQR